MRMALSPSEVAPPLAHVGAGSVSPLELFGLAAMTAAYWVRMRSLERKGRPVPRRRALAFGAAMVLLAVALVGPPAHIGEELLLAHMVQHLLIADIAALLLVIGLTGPVIAPLLRIRVVDRLRFLAHPAVALPLWAVNLYVWHLPALYQGALSSSLVHALEHASFFTAGVLVWMPLFGPLPKPEWFGSPAKLIYIIGVRFGVAILANVFIWSGSVFYPDYGPGRGSWDLGGLADQGVAGAILLIEGSVLTIALFGWLFFRAAREAEERQELLELAAARGVELDPRRAARAVTAGRGAELRDRLAAEGELRAS